MKNTHFAFSVLLLCHGLLLPGQICAKTEDQASSMLGTSQRSEQLYHLLMAEFAGRRANYPEALQHYLEVTPYIKDPKILERTARLAIHAKNNEAAYQTAKQWVAQSPDTQEALYFLVVSATHTGRTHESQDALKQLLLLSPAPAQFGVLANLSEQIGSPSLQKIIIPLAEQPDASANVVLAASYVAFLNKNLPAAYQFTDKLLARRPAPVEATLLKAQMLLSEKKTDEALTHIKQQLKRTPQHVDLRLMYARLLVESGKLEAAWQEFKALEKLNPKSIDVLLALGLMSLEKNDFKNAKYYFVEGLKINPLFTTPYYYLGLVAEKEGDFEQALTWYSNVSEGSEYFNAQIQKTELLARMGQMADAYQTLKAITINTPKEQETLFLLKAQLLQKENNPKEAHQTLLQGVQVLPDSQALRYARALSFERLGQIEPAILDLLHILQTSPSHPATLNAIGYILTAHTTRFTEAENYLNQARTLEPNNPAIMDSLGWLYYKTNRLKEALVLLEKAYLETRDVEIAAHYGEVLWKSGQQPKAKKIWQQSLQRFPDNDVLKNTLLRFKAQP